MLFLEAVKRLEEDDNVIAIYRRKYRTMLRHIDENGNWRLFYEGIQLELSDMDKLADDWETFEKSMLWV